LLNDLVLAGGSLLEVHGGSPVGGLVLLDGARGAVASEELIGARGGGESCDIRLAVSFEVEIYRCQIDLSIPVHHDDVVVIVVPMTPDQSVSVHHNTM
jgi:hypothetical protein